MSKFKYLPVWVFKLIFFPPETSELSFGSPWGTQNPPAHPSTCKSQKPGAIFGNFFPHDFQTASDSPADGNLWIEVGRFFGQASAPTLRWTPCSGWNFSSCHESVPIPALLSPNSRFQRVGKRILCGFPAAAQVWAQPSRAPRRKFVAAESHPWAQLLQDFTAVEFLQEILEPPSFFSNF